MNIVAMTGVTGFVGSVMLKKLNRQGVRTRCLIRDKSKLDNLIEEQNLDRNFIEYVLGDVTQRETLKEVFEGVDTVIHLAAYISTTSIKKAYKKMYSVNVEGTQNVIDTCKELKIEQFIYMSSIEAFGVKEKGEVLTEKLSYRKEFGLIPYGETKAIASELVENAFKRGDIPKGAVVIPGGITGPGDVFVNNFNRAYNFYKSPIFMFPSGIIPIVDVRDLVNIMFRVGESRKYQGEKFFMSTSNMSMEEFAKTLKDNRKGTTINITVPIKMMKPVGMMITLLSKIFNVELKYSLGEFEILEAEFRVDSSLVESEFQFKHRSLETTVKDTVDYFFNNKKDYDL